MNIRLARRHARRIAAVAFLLILLALPGSHAMSALIHVSLPATVVADSTVELVWVNDSLPGGTFVIHYTTDSVTWHLIGATSVLQGEQRYSWTVPRDLTDRAYVKLTYYGDVVGMSDRFAIVGRGIPTIEINDPHPSVVLYSGSRVRILWWLRYPEEISGPIVVEYAPRPGSPWETIVERAPRAPFDSVLWTVPDDTTSFGQIRVRSSDGTVSDTTGARLKVRFAPSLRLVHPAGGETLEIESLVMVVWDARSIDGHYTIEYTSDGGVSWYTIATRHDAREGLDSVAWLVPQPPASSVRVRIAHEEGTLADTSGAFAIVAVPSRIEIERGATLSGSFPNPATSRTTVRWRQERADAVRIELVDLNGIGRLATNVVQAPVGANELAIDLTSFPPGGYRYRIAGAKTNVGGSLIIER